MLRIAKWIGILIICMAAFSSSALAQCPTQTPNVGFQVPNIGNITTWGLCINSDLATIDTLLGGTSFLTSGTPVPTVSTKYTNLITANISAQAIVNFTGGFPGQTIRLICGATDVSTSVVASANITLSGSWSCPSGTTLSLTLVGSVWTEVGRFTSSGITAAQTISIPNAIGGTTTGGLVKLTGSPSMALGMATTDVSGYAGLVISGGGTTGNATIQISGMGPCNFDGATVAGDYVQISPTIGTDCHDTGFPTYPISGDVIGRVLSTNGTNGAYAILIYPPEISAFSGASLANPNIFQKDISFKGPIPYRDVTAYMPSGGCDNTASSLSSQQGTINATSSSLTLNANNTYRNGCGIFIMNAGPASTLLTPGQGAASNPVVIGGAGAATIHYKVVAIDANYGLSAASAVITATFAPSTRTFLNYVAFFWTNVANAVGYLIYTDQNGGGTYIPLGYSYDCAGFSIGTICGAVDKGAETFTWTNGAYQIWPLTPPATNTNEALITTISAGGGTLSVTLAAPATNSVTNSFTLPDNAPFLKAAIADASTDGSQYDKGTVFVPNGMWFASTLPFPAGLGSKGIKISLAGQLQIFGLPIMGPLSGGSTNTGYVSIEGKGGIYQPNDWSTSCSSIWSYPSLGAIFVVSNGSLQLNNICMTNYQAGIIDAPGSVTTNDISFQNVGSGPDIQIDNNAFFSHFVRTNWNSSTFNPVWMLGLTNNAHSSVFDFRDNSFISHGIRYDQVFPSPGYFGNIDFTGTNNIEDNLDHGFINTTTNATAMLNVTADNLVTGDAMTTQYVFYTYDAAGSLPAIDATIHGESQGFAGLLGTAVNATIPTNCRAWTYENSNAGGVGVDSIGYYGSMFGTYSGCDLGMTATGYDVQTTEVLTTGGNDQNGPAGEQIIGHVFRRPRVTIPTTGAGTLPAATYYFVATVTDVAGRESAPSPEVSQSIGSPGSISLSVVTQISFPTGCNIYFGTAPGAELNYFNFTTVTNGTCTGTISTTSGQTPKVPRPIGNAMRSFLSAENTGNSCLFCGSSQGGSGALGVHLSLAQYNNLQPNALASPLLSAEPGLFSSLPTCTGAAEGTTGSVTDSMTSTWGATITGSGGNHVLAYCDGSQWTVVGK